MHNLEDQDQTFNRGHDKDRQFVHRGEEAAAGTAQHVARSCCYCAQLVALHKAQLMCLPKNDYHMCQLAQNSGKCWVALKVLRVPRSLSRGWSVDGALTPPTI